MRISSLFVGIAFGILLIKSEVASWFRIEQMFLFQEAHMYLIIGSAVAVGAASVALIKRLGLHTVDGEQPVLKVKPFHKGTIIGGVLFGLGWAITGACPGPIFAQIGSGQMLALVTLAGALVGAYLYALLKSHLPH
ncbi:MAG: YeeE/YedE thiosulfate transporter family protein [bacterium]|nr:YeeE/YedE thiosulfate transporter family protein [bacterium]